MLYYNSFSLDVKNNRQLSSCCGCWLLKLNYSQPVRLIWCVGISMRSRLMSDDVVLCWKLVPITLSLRHPQEQEDEDEEKEEQTRDLSRRRPNLVCVRKLWQYSTGGHLWH